MTYQIASAGTVKAAFQTTGLLNNTVDPQFRAIGSNWPLLAFAHNLGTVTTKTASVVYAVGYVRDPLVQLLNIPNANSLRGPYYLTRYNNTPDMVYLLRTPCASVTDATPSQITAFLDDYPNALARATNFDNQLTSDALALTPQNSDYASILALSVRQTFGNIELTSGWDGTTYVPTDIMAFLNGM